MLLIIFYAPFQFGRLLAMRRLGNLNDKDYFESLGSLACDRNCPEEIILLWQQEIENLENLAIGKVHFFLTLYVLFSITFS